MQQTTVISASPTETEQFGVTLGKRLRGGEVIELVSDLGGGKTTLTRGIARGAGSTDVVGSPTFTLSKVYTAPTFAIHHFDFYRLQEAGLMEHELLDLWDDPHVVVLVEWGDVVSHVLPEQRVRIQIAVTGDDQRTMTCSYPENLAYVVRA